MKEKVKVQYTGKDMGLISNKDDNDKTGKSIHTSLNIKWKDTIIDHPKALHI